MLYYVICVVSHLYLRGWYLYCAAVSADGKIYNDKGNYTLTLHVSEIMCKCSVLFCETIETKLPYLLVQWLGGVDRAEEWLQINMAFVAEFKAGQGSPRQRPMQPQSPHNKLTVPSAIELGRTQSLPLASGRGRTITL